MQRGLRSAGGAAAALLACMAGAQCAPYPTRTIEIVVSYGAGGSTDLVARTLAQQLQDRLGQAFVVVNRPGASGTIGVASVARAAPDGYTLLLAYTSEMVVVPQISKTAKYSIDDFEPIAVTGLVPIVLIGSQKLRASNLQDLITELAQSPGRYTFGGSLGSPSHILGSWLNRLKNLETVHVPYKGGAQTVGDVMGGHVDMFYAGVSVAKPAIDSAAVKAFAVTGDVRSSALPNVPTFRQAGVPDFELASWNMLLAPKGTPADVVALLKQEVTLALGNGQVRDLLATQGVEASQAPDPKAFLAQERDKFGRVVHELGITMGE